MGTVVVLDEGWTTTSDAEHALRETAARLGLRVRTACTQFRTGPSRVVVLADLDAPPPPELTAGIVTGQDAVLTGRAFVFAGSEALTGVLRVADLLARSAVGDVVMMGAVPVAPDAELDTQDFVRPQFRDGRLVLLARPGAEGRIVPFEQPNPTPCCADHA
jgi:hypothetical protein